jgi:hypothetical protein
VHVTRPSERCSHASLARTGRAAPLNNRVAWVLEWASRLSSIARAARSALFSTSTPITHPARWPLVCSPAPCPHCAAQRQAPARCPPPSAPRAAMSHPRRPRTSPRTRRRPSRRSSPWCRAAEAHRDARLVSRRAREWEAGRCEGRARVERIAHGKTPVRR